MALKAKSSSYRMSRKTYKDAYKSKRNNISQSIANAISHILPLPFPFTHVTWHLCV